MAFGFICILLLWVLQNFKKTAGHLLNAVNKSLFKCYHRGGDAFAGATMFLTS